MRLLRCPCSCFSFPRAFNSFVCSILTKLPQKNQEKIRAMFCVWLARLQAKYSANWIKLEARKGPKIQHRGPVRPQLFTSCHKKISGYDFREMFSRIFSLVKIFSWIHSNILINFSKLTQISQLQNLIQYEMTKEWVKISGNMLIRLGRPSFFFSKLNPVTGS